MLLLFCKRLEAISCREAKCWLTERWSHQDGEEESGRCRKCCCVL